MSDRKALVADALAQEFKNRVAKHADMRFEETKVTLPPRAVWEGYAEAALKALELAL